CALAMQAASLDEGIKMLDEQRYADAAVFFAKAATADPKDYAALFHLALSQSLLEKPDAAIANYEKTLTLKPDLTEAQMNLGILLSSAGHNTRAEQLLNAALEKNPNSANGLLALGRTLMAEGKLDQAEPKLKRA